MSTAIHQLNVDTIVNVQLILY